MTRIMVGAVLSAVFFSSAALAQHSRNDCLLPPAQYIFKNLNDLPAPVVAAAKKTFPYLQPSMTGCQGGGPNPQQCFYTGAEYGNRWVVVVSLGTGDKTKRVPVVYGYTQGADVITFAVPNMAPSGIPMCAQNKLADNTPPPKPSLQQRLSAAAAARVKPVEPPQGR